MKLGKILSAFTAAEAFALAYSRGLCISSPVLDLVAGKTEVSAVIEGGLERRCIAILSFENDNFLPVFYSFEPSPCSGQQVTSFHVPAEAPDGDAYVTWQCSGFASACSHANITGGLGNPTMKLQRSGVVGCVLEALETSTTFVTATRSSTTITTSLAAVFTKTDTGFPLLTGSTNLGSEAPKSLLSPGWHSGLADRGSSTSAATIVGSVTNGVSVSRNTPLATSTTTTSRVDQVLPDSSGSKTATPSLPQTIVSLVSTITVIQTITACSAGG
ncbi:hypothetical protein F5Y14DRAFT_394998 [Nemania sp. NC0429]|nr:hypothetical protein F5Y14DRAFT_394998 [Nemania sp. NC0429]